jgi:hypothetical protein
MLEDDVLWTSWWLVECAGRMAMCDDPAISFKSHELRPLACVPDACQSLKRSGIIFE